MKTANRTRKLRISPTAQCIRRGATTFRVARKFMPDSPKFAAEEFFPEMSGKITALIDKIKNLDALDMRDHGTKFKHFIFTDIRESAYGAKAVAAFLMSAGFELRMGLRDKYVMKKGKRVKTRKGELYLEKKSPVKGGCNGFAVLQSFPLWKNPVSVELKKAILNTYNSRPDNVNGELLRIMVLDSKYKEGIDLFDVKYVHLLEPAIATSDLKQAIGRATRYCGQRGLHFVPRRGWPLQVYVYNTEIPNRDPFAFGTGQKIDAHEFMLANSGLDLALLNLTKELTVLAIASAVDYDLNYKINNFDIEAALLDMGEHDVVVAEVTRGGAVEAIHSVSNLNPELLTKCYGRSSVLFPFTVAKMRQVAKATGMKVPAGARRQWYCDQLLANPAFFRALATSPVIYNEEEWKTPDLFPAPPPPSPARDSVQVQTPPARLDTSLPFAEFQAQVMQLYAKHKWASPIVKNGCEATGAFEPGKPVSFTRTQDFVRHYLTPESPLKGLLAWHSVGTGKTCMAVAAATTQFEKAGYTILWVTRNALMADVYKNIFGSVCSIPIIEHLESGKKIPAGLGAQKRLLSRAWMQPISYRMFQNALQKKNELGRRLYEKSPADPLHKTFLIIDEIHKLKDGDLSASEAADFDTIRDYIYRSYQKSGADSVRPLVMTATPIADKPSDLFEILNMLIPRPADRFMDFDQFRRRHTTEVGTITADGKSYFQEHAKGLISYLNREFDPTTFAQPEFHTVIAPVGEARVPEIPELVDACMVDVDIDNLPPAQCDFEDEMSEQIANIATSGKQKEKEIKQIQKMFKRRTRECKRTWNTTVKAIKKKTGKCFSERRKLYNTRKSRAQIRQLESCFNDVQKYPFVTKSDFNAELMQRLKSADSMDSRGAVRTPLI